MATAVESLDLSVPLEKGVKKIVYVVHRGFLQDKSGKEKDAKVTGIADPVCTRTTEAEAQSIANLLNQAQEGVFYLRYVASNGFPLACGNADELEQKAEETGMREAWERIAAPNRKPLYTVVALGIVEEEDAETFDNTLSLEKGKNKIIKQ